MAAVFGAATEGKGQLKMAISFYYLGNNIKGMGHHFSGTPHLFKTTMALTPPINGKFLKSRRGGKGK